MQEIITNPNTVLPISEIDDTVVGMDTSLKSFINVIDGIFNINEENIEEVYESIINYNKSYIYITNCIEYALKVRPKKVDVLCSLLSKLKKVKGYRPSKLLSDEHKSILAKLGIVPQYKNLGFILEMAEIEKIIKEDDVEKLIKLSADPSFNEKQRVKWANRNFIYYILNYDKSPDFIFECIHYGISLMQLMAFWGSVKCFKYAIMNGDYDENNLAMFAVAGGNNEIIHILEQKGVDFGDSLLVGICFHQNHISDWIIKNFKYTPMALKYTIRCFNVKAFFFNIKNSIDVSQKSIDNALIVSVKMNNVEITKYLIEHLNAYKDMYNTYEKSITDIAVKNNNLEMLKCLVEDFKVPLNVNLYSRQNSFDDLELLKYLIELLDFDKYMPCGEESLESIQYLVEKGYIELDDDNFENSNHDVREYFESKKIVHKAVINQDISTVKRLVEKENYNIDLMINDETPLMIAIRMRNRELIEYFINNHLEKIHYIKDALSSACQINSIDTAKLIIEKCKEKSIPLEIDNDVFNDAFDSKNLELIKYLFQNCDMSKLNLELLIQFSCLEGYFDITKYIIGHNCGKVSEKAFHEACKSGNLELISYLIDELKIDDSYFNSTSKIIEMLSNASRSGNLELVRYIIEKFGITESYFNSTSEIVEILNRACRGGRLELVKFLIENFKIDELNLEMSDMFNLIDNGCKAENLDIIKYLINTLHIDVYNMCKNYESPLTQAAFSNNTSIITFLIEKCHAFYDFSRDIKNIGYPLNIAIQNNNIEMVKYLTKYFEIDYIDLQFLPPIFIAINKSAMNILDYFISMNNDFLDEAVHFSEKDGKNDIVVHLVEKYHANINTHKLEDPYLCKYVKNRELLNEACGNGDLALVKELIEEKNYYINQVIDDECPLKSAIKKGRLEVVKYLIEDKNAYIFIEALALAKKYKQYKVVDYLREKFSLLNACRNNDINRVKEIVEEGNVDVNQIFFMKCSYNHVTALYFAISNNNLEMIKYLIEEAHADLFATNLSLLSSVFYSYNLDIVKYLVEKCNLPVNDKFHYNEPPLKAALEIKWHELFTYLVDKCHLDPNTELYAGKPISLLINQKNTP